MKTNTKILSLTGIAIVAALLGVAAIAQAQNGNAAPASVKTMAPSVIKTVPQAGDTAVDPALTEIKVTFSKDMTTQRSWSVCQVSDQTFPQLAGEVHYQADKRTCVVPVKLEPGKTYVLWFNQPKFHGFRDADNIPAVPYLLVFETKK